MMKTCYLKNPTLLQLWYHFQFTSAVLSKIFLLVLLFYLEMLTGNGLLCFYTPVNMLGLRMYRWVWCRVPFNPKKEAETGPGDESNARATHPSWRAMESTEWWAACPPLGTSAVGEMKRHTGCQSISTIYGDIVNGTSLTSHSYQLRLVSYICKHSHKLGDGLK